MRYDAVAGKSFFVLVARKNMLFHCFSVSGGNFSLFSFAVISLFVEQLLCLRSHSHSLSFLRLSISHSLWRPYASLLQCEHMLYGWCVDACKYSSVRCNACDLFKRGVAADWWLWRYECLPKSQCTRRTSDRDEGWLVCRRSERQNDVYVLNERRRAPNCQTFLLDIFIRVRCKLYVF